MAEGGDVSHPNGEGETRGGATQPFRENMEVVARFFSSSGIRDCFAFPGPDKDLFHGKNTRLRHRNPEPRFPAGRVLS